MLKTEERFNPKEHESNIIIFEHWHRYHYASNFTKNLQVLDIASGSGYGSYLLAKNAKHVYGIDISEEAIQHSSNNYKLSNLDYLQGSITSIPLNSNSLDIVVSFETIEHIDEVSQKQALNEIKRVLKDDGILIMSTPNLDSPYYKNVDNEFHIKEFYFKEYEKFLSQYFSNIEFLGQSFYTASQILANSTNVDLKETSLRNIEQLNRVDVQNQKFIISISSDKTFENKFFSSILTDKANGFFAEINQYTESLSSTLNEKDKYIESINQTIKEKNDEIGLLSQEIEKRTEMIDEKDKYIESINQTIKEKNDEKDKYIESINQTIKEKNDEIGLLSQEIEKRTEMIDEKDKYIESINQTIKEKNDEIGLLSQEIEKRTEMIDEKDKYIESIKHQSVLEFLKLKYQKKGK